MIDFALSFLVFLLCVVLIQVVVVLVGVMIRELVVKPFAILVLVLYVRRMASNLENGALAAQLEKLMADQAKNGPTPPKDPTP